MFGWWTRSRPRDLNPPVRGEAEGSRWRQVGGALDAMRARMRDRVQQLNRMTADETTAAASLVNDVVERARVYVQDSQRALSKIEGGGEDGVGQLLGSQSSLVRDHAREMSARAAVQDERARQAAAAAKSIADLAASIDRLAGEARLLAVNARIESSRLGAHSAGFEVLASEMQRLSDEVAGANERVSELAARLGTDLPQIAQHARDFLTAMQSFAETASTKLDETERGVNTLRTDLAGLSRAGGAAMEDILRASRGALSHLQFQDVVAQELRAMDARIRDAQVEVAQLLGADPASVAAIPAAEYTTMGGDMTVAAAEAAPIAPSGEVMLF